MKRLLLPLFAFCLLAISSPNLQAASKFITVASTTSTANSGLFDFLLPPFTKETGIEVRVIAVGTGQAIRLARKGDADVLFVHHRPSEEKFVAEGFGKKRFDVMYNDFVIVGPDNDPAGIRNCEMPGKALAQIRNAGAPFVSRGDDSGTHKRELAIWKSGGVEAGGLSGQWYRSTGSGMGATLNIASAMNGYALSDRGTWLSFKNRGNLEILCEGHASMFNPYGVVAVSQERFGHIKEDLATTFVDWLISPAGQKLIKEFQVEGEQLFIPNAK